jgi:hypothetical protein
MHDDSLYEVAAGDPRIAKLLRTSLQQLTDRPPGPLREMAEAVLRGHMDLRRAALSDAYGGELGAAFGRFWSEYQHMDPQERDRLMAQAEEHLDQLLDDEPQGRV